MRIAENPKQRAFLEELSALSRKHGIIIAGCGCCDSPYLTTERVPDPGHEHGLPFYAMSEERVVWSRRAIDESGNLTDNLVRAW